jgi:hypothetical protein
MPCVSRRWRHRRIDDAQPDIGALSNIGARTSARHRIAANYRAFAKISAHNRGIALPATKKLLWWTGGLLFALAAVLLLTPREDAVRLLYATGPDRYDRAALASLRQSTAAQLRLTQASLDSLNLKQLRRFDAVYLDVGLHGSETLKRALPALQRYVEEGGHLFLENDFATDFPAEFLGAAQIVDVPAPAGTPRFVYPETGENLKGMQTVFRLFSDNFMKHVGMDAMPGFRWGKGTVNSTAQSLVEMDGVSLYSVNRPGRGTVVLAGTFLPNRYFVTGYDLKSGMDISQGFAQLIARHKERYAEPTANAAYFDRNQIAPEPYFNFAFAAANTLFRTEFISFVAKEKFGYSVKKVFGPYGRPAMAFQNHFEGLSAIRDREGIQWAELLKRYNLIPSFTLVRASYDWGEWRESVVAHLNAGTTEQPRFEGELANSFYSSGVHLMSDGKLLSLSAYPEYKSLGDPIELPYRAYPAIADLSGDGVPDLVAGSADGFVYLFRNVGAQPEAYARQPLEEDLRPPDAFAPPERLLLRDGRPLSSGAVGYAAIAAADLTGDSVPDLVIGGADGALSLAAGASASAGGALRFAAPAPMADTEGRPLRVAAHAAPTVGDVDGDGVPDLVVGDASGGVHLFRGVPARNVRGTAFEPGRLLFRINAKYAAPAVKDMNGDGVADVLVGNNEGDLLLYLQREGRWEPAGPLAGGTVNQLGSRAIVGGHNSVPLWFDINHDGRDDLLVGQLEFGLPYAIDDPDFPYRNELAQFIDYIRANHLELFPHLFFHNFMSDEAEKREIALHRQAFEKLGIPWHDPGTNQHTWRINNVDRLQTLRNEAAAGIWYNFGFQPPNSPNTPSWGTDYIWSLPFLLEDGGLDGPMVLHTPMQLFRPDGPYANTDIYEAFAFLDLPIDYFEHIEYHFPNRVHELEQFAGYLDKLRTAEDYNFMTEPQMARSFLTVLTSEVKVTQTWGTYLWHKFKDRFGKGKHFSRTIRASVSAVPKQAGEYARTLGVVVEPGEMLQSYPLRSTSDVFLVKGANLYTAVAGKTTVSIDWRPEPLHIVRANVPIEVRKAKDRWTIELKAAGMQQIKLSGPYPLDIEGDGLNIERHPDKYEYTVTRYGDKTAIVVNIDRRDADAP